MCLMRPSLEYFYPQKGGGVDPKLTAMCRSKNYVPYLPSLATRLVQQSDWFNDLPPGHRRSLPRATSFSFVPQEIFWSIKTPKTPTGLIDFFPGLKAQRVC